MHRLVQISLISTLMLICMVATAQAQGEASLVINEFMASNTNTIRDPQGQFDDWIEIFNYGSGAVDIGRIYLTDDLANPTKWQIPSGISIPSGGYLLIWADEDSTASGLHADFKLDAAGEEIGLFDSDGITLIDSIAFNSQTNNISFGRFPDADENWQLFAEPTPGSANTYSGIVEALKFSRNRSFYDEPFYLTIATETEGASIYYTLDGRSPYNNENNIARGVHYTEPVLITQTTCLRAIAVKSGLKPSNIETHTYIFLNDVIRQDYQAAVVSGFPTSWAGSSPDYGMDPDVIGVFDASGNSIGRDKFRGAYAATIRDDLKSIPTMSIVMNLDDMFGVNGIYSNSLEKGAAWERPASIEMIYPDDQEGFQVNCGIRIQGGYFRLNGLSRKHSFRLLFKEIYGPTKLEFPLFGEDGVDSFDTIVLRAGANDGYAWQAAQYTEQYTRDEFGRRLQLATGNVSAHGNFVHLYINGFYWGLYNSCERPDNSFSASYNGGKKENWDTIHEGGYPGDIETTNGDFEAWNQMIAKCQQAASSNEAYQELQGKNPDGTPNPAYPNLLDVQNYIDYLIVNIWAGNWDWPWKNYWIGRDRSENSTGFKFYNWDFENTLGNNLERSPLNKNALNNNFDDVGLPHQSLRNNSEYRLLFADHIHTFFFNDGILTPESLTIRYANIAAEIERAMVGESARWGDMQYRDEPLTLEDWYDSDSNYNDGRAGRDWILNYYIPQRSDIVLQQFRNAGLYPDISAPISHINGSYKNGGLIDRNHSLSMTSDTGTIWYTIDGSDPHLSETSGSSSRNVLVPEGASKRVLVPAGPVSDNWKNVGFDDSNWLSGTGGVGYDTGSEYRPLFNIDLYNQMYLGNPSCYIRIPFTVNQDLSQYNFMTLRMRYDDGFVAYINGIEVARSRAPESLQWDSVSTSQNPDAAAKEFEDFDLSSSLNLLNQGQNILAIHGLNISTTSSDFLISTELLLAEDNINNAAGVSKTALEYTDPVQLTNSTKVKARVLSEGTWSALNEAVFAVGPVAQSLRITEIMYHPQQAVTDANDPNEEYIELTNIGTESVNLNLVGFTNGIDFTFPNMELAPGQYCVVVENRDAFEAKYGMDITIAGQYSGKLNNNGERIRLEDAIGQIILDFSYNDNWRSITDGDGFSLTIIDPTNPDPNSWSYKDSWRASAYTGGSPGWDDAGIVPNPGAVVINEVLSNPSANGTDWIELHNTTNQAIDISGWFLSDSNSDLTKYKIAAGTMINPNGYIVFYQDRNFGNTNDAGTIEPLALSSNGEAVYLSSAEDDVITGYRNVENFGPSQTGVSFGRYYKTSTDSYNFVAMERNTPGAANSNPVVGPIVISEIMYNPDWPDIGFYVNDAYEYIELHNISSSAVTLFDSDSDQPWKFTDGIIFTFPTGNPVTIPAGGYLLVVKNPDAFAWLYPDVPSSIVIGPYDGQLSDAGEVLELGMPGDVDNSGEAYYIRVDRVSYSDGSHPDDAAGSEDLWPVEADGTGLSLHKISIDEYGNDPANWIASATTPGR